MNPTNDTKFSQLGEPWLFYLHGSFEARAPPLHNHSTWRGSLDSTCSRCRFRRVLHVLTDGKWTFVARERRVKSAGRTRVDKELGVKNGWSSDNCTKSQVASSCHSFFVSFQRVLHLRHGQICCNVGAWLSLLKYPFWLIGHTIFLPHILKF